MYSSSNPSRQGRLTLLSLFDKWFPLTIYGIFRLHSELERTQGAAECSSASICVTTFPLQHLLAHIFFDKEKKKKKKKLRT